MAHSTGYETPEEDLTESIRTLGKEVQLTTFKTNLPDAQQQDVIKPETRKVGVLCAGSCDFRDKIVYIRHYLGEKPSFTDSNCILSAETVVKDIVWCEEGSNSTHETSLKVHLTVLGQNLPERLTRYYINRSESTVEIIGAIVFSAASNTTFTTAIEWKNVVEKSLGPGKKIPIVLLIENINGSLLEDEKAMQQFCRDNGFVRWFEITKSDWELGERNEFGRAVDVVLQELELGAN